MFVLGHENIKDTINKLYKNNQLPHTWLFNGIEGIGKGTLARILAYNLLSEPMLGLNVNDDSIIWEKPEIFHPDLLIIENKNTDENTANSNKEITIDKVREINDFLYLTPNKSKWRIVIIDAVDHLNKNASNALLKILEDAPKHVCFFLINHSIGLVLPTIKSRCFTLKFLPLQETIIKKLLASYLDDTLDESYQKTLYHLSNGSIKKAMFLHDINIINFFPYIEQAILSKDYNYLFLSTMEEFSSKYNSKDFFNILLYALQQWLEIIIKSKSHITDPITQTFFDLNKIDLSKIFDHEIWVLFDKIKQLPHQINLLNFDPQMIWIDLVSDFRKVFKLV
ncbi:MAG: AAA family ATPase [Alphaproteobacteria bacterium]|nr:AAA family ATPase [Alphaproteobacteria bacterium]